MKRIFTYIFLFTLFLNSYTQNPGNWEILNEGKGYFGNIDFVSDDVGFMVTNGNFLKTVDGGDTWDFVSQISDGEALISDWGAFYIDFTSEYHGWALSQPNYKLYQILNTTDGGYTWQIQKESTDFRFRSMQVVSDSVVLAWDQQLVTKTTDGGKNWIDITPDVSGLTFNSVWFTTPDTGFIACIESSILKTSDGGNNWTEIRMPGFRHLDQLKFFNGSQAYVLAERGRYFIASSDTFKTWTTCDLDSAIIYSYALLDENTIFAVNRNHPTYGSEYPVDGGIMYSADAGLTWQALNNPAYGTLSEIYFNSKKDLFVISPCAGSGWAGIPVSNLWKSSDLGNNWQLLIFSYPFNDVFFSDRQKGFLSYAWTYRCGELCFGTTGGVFTTNDGGMSRKRILKQDLYKPVCLQTMERDIYLFLIMLGLALGREI